MEFVCRIDIEKYKVVTPCIRTDEVVITDERIQHIKERRGEAFYEEYRVYFKEIVENPDYIFRDKQSCTALACKTIDKDGVAINLAVRLAIEDDDPKYKNSIITAIKESKKRFEQRLRNNIPLYKRE